MSLISKLKKSLIILSIPIVTSCSTIKLSNIEAYKDYMYPSDKIIRVEKTFDKTISPRNINPEYNNIETKVNSNITYYNSEWINKYSSNISNRYLDSDGDGISNFQDPSPYRFGPYIDSNFNGLIDPFDIRIFNYNFYWNNWNYPNYYPIYTNGFYSYNKYFNPINTIIIYTNKENNIKYGKRPSREEFSNKTQNTNNSRINRSNTNINRNNSNNNGRIYQNRTNDKTSRENNWNISPSRSYQNNRNSNPGNIPSNQTPRSVPRKRN